MSIKGHSIISCNSENNVERSALTFLLERWGNLGPEKLGEGMEPTLESRS